jgi:acetyl-CoA carboxylase biotin carboxyl carrier protein
MEFKDLKKIIDLVKEREIVEFDLQDGDFRLSTKLKGPEVVPSYVAPAPLASAVPAPVAPAAAAAPAEESAPAGPGIDSPMVGTFYRASSPEADAFVKVGDTVSPETTVCIIEAMKVMNEIKAECKGTVTKILVENGEAVEFGQKMFEIQPA